MWESIRQYYGIQSNGARFLDFANIKYSPNKRHEALYQELVAFIEDNFLTLGCGLTHHGENVDEDEMTPTLENLIVLTWLQLIHPGLPQLVKETFGTELRKQTLASIKTEISQSLPSMLCKLNSVEDSTVMYTTSTRQPKSQHTTNHKECPICKAANRHNTNHYLTECKYLPERDRRYLTRKKQPKTRKVTVEVPISESEESSDDDTEAINESETVLHSMQSTPATSSTRRVDTSKSPFFKAFYKQHPVTITLDTGAETNMVKSTLAHYLGVKVRKSTHTARQADGTTPLHIIGETTFTVSLRGVDMKLEALVVSDIDLDILAGIPFMMVNDVAVRPSRHEIVIREKEVLYYGPTAPPTTSHTIRRTQAHMIRAPPRITTVWPGEYLEVDVPASLSSEEIIAIEPRSDLKQQNWPPPAFNESC